MKVIKQYEDACNKVLREFSKKQDIYPDGWVLDEIGIASFYSQYFIHIDDMVLDLKTNQPKGLIISWHDDTIEHNADATDDSRFIMNYRSYTMGLRYEQKKT